MKKRQRRQKEKKFQEIPADSHFCLFAGGLIFVSLFAYCYSFIGQGLEVTDTGFSLTKQMVLVTGWEEYPFGMVWLSDFIGGTWLKLFDSFGLLGAQFGWCFLTAIGGVICFSLLQIFVPIGLAALLAIFTGISINPSGLMILYYSNVPGPLVATAALFLVLCFRYLEVDPKKAKIFGSLYCIFISTCFMAKFPMILALLSFPLVPLLAFFLVHRRWSRSFAKTCGLLYLGSFLSTAMFLMTIFLSGNFSEYIDQVKTVLGFKKGVKVLGYNSADFLLNMYWEQLASQLGKAFLFVGIFWGAYLVAMKILEKNIFKSNLVPSVGLMALGFALIFFGVEVDNTKFLVFVPVLALVAALVSLFWIVLKKPVEKSQALVIVLGLILGIGTTLVSFAGSNNGFRIALLGMWLLLPLGFCVLQEKKSNSKKSHFLRLDAFLAVGILAALAWKAYEIRLVSPYRDSPNRAHYTTEVQFSRLKGIKTSASRAKSFGDFINRFQSLVKEGDTILTYNSIPIVYFLTKTRPYLNDTWLALRSRQKLQNHLDLVKGKPLPRFVAKALTNTQHPQWGMGRKIPLHYWVYQESEKFMDSWVRAQGYQPIWNNSDFVIFELK